MLLALIYGKTKNGWRLYHFQMGNYSIYGKTAIDYYKNAQIYDSKGYLVDAGNNLFFAQ